MEDGKEHLSEVLVLHVLLRSAKPGGQHISASDIDILFLLHVLVRPCILILRWHRTDRNPVAVTLALGVESRTYTNPILCFFAVFVRTGEDIAETVVTPFIFFGFAIRVGLRRCTVDNLLQLGHLFWAPV